MIDTLKQVVRDHEASRPRSLQTAIGPSEVGAPCDRRLAYKLLQTEPVNTDSDPWAAIVGTSVHAWLDTAFADENQRIGRERWLTSLTIDIPTYVTGTIDLYDTDTASVIDHKVVGATAYKRYAKEGPSEQYRIQGHVYAAGLRIAGYPAETVAIAFWSRSGALKDSFYWSEPYDETIVEKALSRLDALRTTTSLLGTGALPLIGTTEAFCSWCPYYLPGVTDVEDACPGHAGAGSNPTAKELTHD
jgi:hypothetical protein